MGHRDSSAQFGSDGGVFVAGSGVAGAAATRGTAGAIGSAARSIGAWALLFAIRFYMVLLSPFFGGACKFHPSCSNYAYEAVARHGARRGGALAVKRLLRCRPFTKGGFDPVPEPEELQGLKASTCQPVAGPASNLRGLERLQ
jgi:uncharacterized protein